MNTQNGQSSDVETQALDYSVKRDPSPVEGIAYVVLVLIVASVIVVVILMLLGPPVGNIFSNISGSL